MSPNDFKKLLFFLRKTEKEMTSETFLIIFGKEWQRLWDEFRNFDYSLTLFFTCISIEEQDKLCIYLSKNYK